ncbi:protein kinase, partial [bacterium]|nr:protein kinase [bacterium]
IGRYKLLEKLGEGGFGSVWAAEQREPVKRRVALKIIKLGMDTKQVVARFEAERQALALMDHPNIAKVLDAGSTDTGRPYFVMELVKGIPITKYCDQEKLNTTERLDLFIKVCHAIQHAHQKGIIHRDIKPSNIMVTLHDGVPVPKVIDFGIAKATQQELTEKTIYTQYSQFIGTPAYMSPEQAEMSGLDIDTRSDIYSLGVLLYELLTGTTPFDTKELMASGLDEMRKIIREREPVRPSTRLSQTLTNSPAGGSLVTRHSSLPTDLDWIAMKCLEKDRSRRYDTANGLATDIIRHLNNEPVVARPPSATYKIHKAWRRHRTIFTAALAVVAALVLGLGLTLWQYAGKSRAEQEQVHLREKAEGKAREANELKDRYGELLYDSLLREARSIRRARQPGYRHVMFDRIKQAIALGTSNANPAELRREAVSSFGDWAALDPVDIDVPTTPNVGCLSADGSLAAMDSGPGQKVLIVQTRSGRTLASLDIPGTIVSLAFDPRGMALYVSGSKNRIVLDERLKDFYLEKWSLRGDASWRQDWRRETEAFTRFFYTDAGPVTVSFPPDDSVITVEDVERNKVLASIRTGTPIQWFPVANVSTDRKMVAFFSVTETNRFDSQLEIWDLKTSQRLKADAPRLGMGWGVYFSRVGDLISASFTSRVILYDSEQLGRIYTAEGSSENNWGAPVGEGDLIAVPATQELTVRLMRARSGREAAILNVGGIPNAQYFNHDGTVLMVLHDRGARIVRLRAEGEKLQLTGHQGGVPAMEFTPDGSAIVSAGKDRTLRVWDLPTTRSRTLGTLPAAGQTVAISPEGSYVATGYYDIGDLSIWSLRSGQQVTRLGEVSVRQGATWNCIFSPDGKNLAAIGNGVRVWDTSSLAAGGNDKDVHIGLRVIEKDGWSSVAMDPAGKWMAYQVPVSQTEPGATVTVRSTELEGRPQIVATNLELNPIQSICFLPKTGDLAYVTRGYRDIVILESGTWKPIRKIKTRPEGDTSAWYVANICASPDGSQLANVSTSGLGVDIYDPATGEYRYSLPEEATTIWWLAWSPDSRHIAVSRANGEISIWNLNEVENQLAQLGLKP